MCPATGGPPSPSTRRTRSTSTWRTTMAASVSKRHPSIEPSLPGALLAEIVIPATGKSRSEIARLLGISRMSLYAVLRGRQGVTPAMAARLRALFGNGPAFWLDMQPAVDLWHAERDLASELAAIEKSRLKVATME